MGFSGAVGGLKQIPFGNDKQFGQRRRANGEILRKGKQGDSEDDDFGDFMGE
jgi:hypothetical protein